jgi:biotin carboxyl carrier protein
VTAPGQTADPLAERLRRLAAERGHAGWAANLLGLARELTLAEAGAVLAEGEAGWQVLAAAPDAPPAAWAALAAGAPTRGVVAAPEGREGGREGRWLFAAACGPAAPGGPPAVLVLDVAAKLPMDLVLTRERLAFLGALAEAAAPPPVEDGPATLAALAAEALRSAPSRAAGLHAAAQRLAAALPGVERAALVQPRARRLGLSDQREALPSAPLPRRLLALAEEAADRAAPHLMRADSPETPAERGFAEAEPGRALLSLPEPSGELVLLLALAPGAAVSEAAPARLAPLPALLVPVARARPQGGGRPWGRIAALAAVLALAGLALLPRPLEVGAPVLLQPERAQVVTAPQDGTLEASEVRPGDAVAAGVTPLARLATRDLELELAAARARAANDRREAAVARAAGNPAQEQIASLAARRAEAQVALIEHRIGQADIRAPADGLLVSGDLRRSIGQPVTRGQVLFEIALDGPLRAEVLVLDRDGARVAAGQRVRLSLAAEPGVVRTATIERVRPMAEFVQGRNVFRAIARLDTPDAALRPGMEGWARVETGRTTWGAWLVREPVLWVRRWLWI